MGDLRSTKGVVLEGLSRRCLRSTEGVLVEERSRVVLAFLSETLDSVRRIRLSVDMEGASLDWVPPVSVLRIRLDSSSTEEERLAPVLSIRPKPELPEAVNRGGATSLRLGSNSCRSKGLGL